jgi:hypothetical protein
MYAAFTLRGSYRESSKGISIPASPEPMPMAGVPSWEFLFKPTVEAGK